MAALNGGLGSTSLNNGSAGTMDALTQAYSGIQQYTASALPSLYNQSLLQQGAAGSQKEGRATALSARLSTPYALHFLTHAYRLEIINPEGN